MPLQVHHSTTSVENRPNKLEGVDDKKKKKHNPIWHRMVNSFTIITQTGRYIQLSLVDGKLNVNQ